MKTLENPLSDSILEIFPNFSDRLFKLFITYLNTPTEQLIQSPYLTLDKPYGRNYILAIEDDYGFSFARLKCGQTSSEHYHERRKEFFIVRKGQLTLTKNGKKNLISLGEWNHSTPHIIHSIQNASESEELEILEIFSPALLDDKVRIKDRYNRKIGKVEHLE